MPSFVNPNRVTPTVSPYHVTGIQNETENKTSRTTSLVYEGIHGNTRGSDMGKPISAGSAESQRDEGLVTYSLIVPPWLENWLILPYAILMFLGLLIGAD